MQLYYFWKKLGVDYKIPRDIENSTSSNQQQSTIHHEARPYVCEMPDCSAVSATQIAGGGFDYI